MQRTNYIHVLQDRVAELERELAAQVAKEHEIVLYLALPKFREDTTVQVGDILLRLGRI
jgi:hypothetical protein